MGVKPDPASPPFHKSTVTSLNEAVANYLGGQLSLDEFAGSLRKLSRGKFSESEDARKAILEIESAFSGLDFEGASEAEFRQELANAFGP